MASYLRFLLGLFLSTHLLVLAFIFFALVWTKARWARSLPSTQNTPPAVIQPPTVAGTALPSTPVPSPSPAAVVSPSPSDASSPSATNQLKLIIPVAGVRASALRDTYNDARSQGRVHNAIDIMAPRATPVLAASDGEIIRLYSSNLGGNTIYQYNPGKNMVFYYAHLERYAEGIVAGHAARQGEVIAYVGDTGNAGAGNYHLHFAIWFITDPTRYWDGVNIDPYPILKNAL